MTSQVLGLGLVGHGLGLGLADHGLGLGLGLVGPVMSLSPSLSGGSEVDPLTQLSTQSGNDFA